MKNGLYVLFCVFLGLAGILAVLLYNHLNPKSALISPVLGISKTRIGDNVWFPRQSSESAHPDAPGVTAKSAFFVEAQTGEVLYQKNQNQRLPIASLTKIMTSIVALENKSLSDVYIVSQRASEMEPDKMLLISHEKLNLEELLSGIFLVSANDAAEVIAEGTSGRREEFINLMNSKASQLGMVDTLFINPSGLEEDDPKDSSKTVPQYSSAYDVALMSRYLIRKWPEVVKITSNPHIYLPVTPDHQDYDLYSGINLLTTYPGVMGLKTGFTPEAGLTLVTLAKRGEKEVIGVLLGATDRRDDARALLDYSFKKLGV